MLQQALACNTKKSRLIAMSRDFCFALAGVVQF